MNRAELERLDREDLVARAEAAGVTRARILTRPELVDELLLRSTSDVAARSRARGFFGMARDLLASVVERGLHLPDAAERIRTLGGPLPSHRPAPAALPTVTLAEIYAAQGHRDRAIETLEGVLAREPEHAAERTLLVQLEDASFPVPEPRLPPEDEEPPSIAFAGAGPESEEELEDEDFEEEAPAEPMHMLDDAPLPPRYDVDECVAIPVDPHVVYVYWEVRGATLAAAGSGDDLTLRVVVVVPTWDGPRTTTRDFGVDGAIGEYFVRDLPDGALVRVAIGTWQGETFVPIAHSPALDTPPGGPSPLVADALVRWTPRGAVPVRRTDADAASIDRALGYVRREEARRFLGSSEQWMRLVTPRA